MRARGSRFMPGTSGGTGVFLSGSAVTTSGQALPEPPLQDWLELLDAVRRRINRRLLRPEEEELIKKTIRQRFPEAELG